MRGGDACVGEAGIVGVMPGESPSFAHLLSVMA